VSTYANGRIPASRLVAISGGGRLLSGAAAAWEQLRNTVHARYGWWPTPTDSLSSYRPYETQERIFRERYTTSYIAGAKIKIWNGVRWYLRPGKVTAAVPGTSNHGLGVAVDITGLGGFSGARYKQLASVAQGLGWSNVEGRSIGEAWHWVFTGTAELVSGGPGSIGGEVPDVVVTPPNPIEEDDLPYTPEDLKAIMKSAALEAVNQALRAEQYQLTKATRDAERDEFRTTLRADMLEQANKSRQAVYNLLVKIGKKIGVS